MNLTARNAGGADDERKVDYIAVSAPVVIPPAPVANFTATPRTGTAPLAVQFTDASTGTGITAWSWTFGDGQTSNLQSPSHTYTTAGNYTVNLTARNAGGADDERKVDYIAVSAPVVIPPAPVANFTANPRTGIAPLAVQFTDASTGTGITAWSWTFGDGTTATGQSPSHTYTTAGNYTVNLTVRNAGGADDERKVSYIAVTAAPSGGQASYRPFTVPCRVEAEDYDTGGEGVAYHDTTAGNSGGAYRTDDVDVDPSTVRHVGYVATGEWIEYTVNVTTAGTYPTSFRVGSWYPSSGHARSQSRSTGPPRGRSTSRPRARTAHTRP